MIAFLAAFLRLFFLTFESKRNVLSKSVLLKKENDILLRRVGKQGVHFNIYDKLFFNFQRPHQGIQQQIPKPGEPGKTAVRFAGTLSWVGCIITTTD